MAEDFYHSGSRIKHGYLVVSVMLCLFLVAKASTNNIGITSQSGSWWEARELCRKEYGGDLYIPESMLIPSNLTYHGSYWVGAFETTDWKLADNSPVFRHIGYLTNYESSAPSRHNLPGNSASQCYRKCSSDTFFGLSGTECYCLDDDEDFNLGTTVVNEITCPGNANENCGNASGMAVYKNDIQSYINLNGDCVYAHVQKNTWGPHRQLDSGKCNESYKAICSNTYGQHSASYCYLGEYSKCRDGICTTCNPSSWSSANNSCNLVKLTNENKDTILNIMTLTSNDDTRYWIGMHRLSKKIWINGSEVYNVYDDYWRWNPKCLAVWYNGHILRLKWRSCSWDRRALCVNNKTATDKTTVTNVVMTSRSSTSTDIPRATATVTNRISRTTTDSSSKESTELDRTAGNLPSLAATNGLYMYIGIGLGLLVLAVLITAVIVVMKRRKKFCFHKEQRTAVRFQTGTENLTYHSGPQEDLAPSYMSVEPGKSANGQSANGPTDPNKPNIVSDLYSKVNKPQRKTVDCDQMKKETRNMDSTKGFDDMDVYSRAGACGNLGVVENCYNHLNTGDENDYDTAGRKPEPDRRDSTYNHLGAIQDATEQHSEHNKDGDRDYYNIESTRK